MQAIKQPWLRRRKAKRKFVVLPQGIGCVAVGRWSRDLGSAGSCAGGGSRRSYPIGSAFQPLGRGRRPTVPAHGPSDNPNSIVRGCSYRLDLCVGCGRKRRVVGRAGQAPDPRISRLPTAESCPALPCASYAPSLMHADHRDDRPRTRTIVRLVPRRWWSACVVWPLGGGDHARGAKMIGGRHFTAGLRRDVGTSVHVGRYACMVLIGSAHSYDLLPLCSPFVCSLELSRVRRGVFRPPNPRSIPRCMLLAIKTPIGIGI